MRRRVLARAIVIAVLGGATPPARADDAHAIRKTMTPLTPAPPRADRPPPAPPPREPDPSRANDLLTLGVAIEAGSRNFTYVDRITPTLRPYDLFAAPLASVNAEVYPLARAGVPVLAGLGLTGDYAVAFGLSSVDANGTSVSGSWDAYDFGARERIPIGRAFVLGVHAGYGASDYSFGSELGAGAVLPDVAYRFLRAGLDARVSFGPLASFSLAASASYLDVLSSGAFGADFPRADVGGVEASVGAAQTIARVYELALSLGYTRFYSSLHPRPGDAFVAGGALDEMARVSLGFSRFF